MQSPNVESCCIPLASETHSSPPWPDNGDKGRRRRCIFLYFLQLLRITLSRGKALWRLHTGITQVFRSVAAPHCHLDAFSRKSLTYNCQLTDAVAHWKSLELRI